MSDRADNRTDNTEKSGLKAIGNLKEICDRACENQPSGRIKIALFFQICPFIIHNLFITTTQIFYHIYAGESFKAYRMLILYLELEIFIVM